VQITGGMGVSYEKIESQPFIMIAND